MPDSVSLDMAALVDITNALVRLVNDNTVMRARLMEALKNGEAQGRSGGSTGGEAEGPALNSTEESLLGQAGEGEAKG